MEQKLKKQRRRLIMRVTLILVVVWLAVSVTYCAIRFHNEKTDMQNSTLSDISYAKQMLTIGDMGADSSVYICNQNLLNFKDLAEKNNNTQLIIIDPDSQEIISDTSCKVNLQFSIKNDTGVYPDCFACVDYREIRNRLSDAQFQRITDLLNADPGDGGSYELVCTEFYCFRDNFKPLVLSVMLVSSPDSRFDQSTVIEDFPLSGNAGENQMYRNAENRINIIPKDFFLSQGYSNDYIGTIDGEELKKNVAVISSGTAEYIFFTSEYLFLDAYVYDNETNIFVSKPKLYIMQYAKKANLLDNCLSSMVWGIAVIFGFFFVIGAIICIMIWNTVRAQIIQEQKRVDLTNALAHDIKTPLFVISGYAYSLKENIDGDDRDSYLDKIILQTEQINGLVHKMLNLSKLDSCGITLNRSEFDLYGLVAEILDDYRSLPDGRRIVSSYSGESGISADRELIKTALQNLIENAVKYSPAGSEILIEVTDGNISISNPSEPLTKAELKKIWQPYFRMDRSRHRKGNGLGLSIVKSILDLHGVKYNMSMKEDRIVFYAEFR